jgi:hypothetical protein
LGAALPELRVRVHDGKLTLHADGVPLSGVLWAITAQTEIELIIAEDEGTGGPMVVDTFKDLPIDRGVERLLRKHLKHSSFVLVTDAKGRLTSLRILPGAFGEVSSARIKAPPREGTVPAREPSTGRGRSRRVEVPTHDTGDAIGDAVEAARKATDPTALIKALLALGSFQDARTLEALHPALQSDKGEVRRAALEAMREGTVSDAVVLADVRAMVTWDPDPEVKQAALDVVVRYDEGVEGRALLKVLAADKSSALSKLAAAELRRMEEEDEQRRLPDTQVRQAPIRSQQRGGTEQPR